MEGAFSLSPLWNELSIVRKAAPTLKALHGMVLKRILRDIPLPEPGGQKLQTEDILGAVSSFIPQLLLDLSEDNDVLSGIRALAAAEAQRHNPWAIVQASISMWYAEVVPVLAKELKSTEDDTREKWGLDVAWENIDFQELPFANLGLMAMLVVGDIWENPTDLKLQSACLIAHTAVSFLFIARILGPHIIEYPWRSLSTYIQGQRAQELVFKVSLSIAAKGYSLSRPPQGPAIEFNVDPRNIRVSNQGRKLLVRVAIDEEWRSLPFWHPYRRVPGSPWNNYIKNTQWRTFSTSPRPPPTWIKYHLPSSAHTLTDAIEDDYNSLRAQISQVSCLPHHPLKH
uniref:MAT 1.1.2 n=4 Tax=Fusarium solani species complex TaxID=232080 RepID=A0A075MED5_FUSSH|nr:MAT 1.1.2 [Fusarium tucumaniae]AIF79388.1 MAT 1.1.2 [Fusarium phaseoli]AIF79393.1 MAT 1.1.2 [Fusarium brasiliense]AIF79402.1 MAT 1.1.2 [Fusarium cuneirostrum]